MEKTNSFENMSLKCVENHHNCHRLKSELVPSYEEVEVDHEK